MALQAIHNTKEGEQAPNEVCFHCDAPISLSSRLEREGKLFCCSGCLTVNQILTSEGLEDFYLYRQEAGISLQEYDELANYNYLDDPDFRKKYAPKKFEMSFFLEGVHCLACLWLIEKGCEKVSGIKRIRLNMTTSIALVEIEDDATFAEIATYFNKIGYRPHPIETDGQAIRLKRKENRNFLSKLAVAGFCAGNIMLLAVSLYAGAANHYREVLSWLSGLLYLPIIFYSSLPFYQSSYKAIKNKILSLDIPISGILIIGSLASYYSLIVGSDHFYFDSLAMFVFLLLGSRYLLMRIQQLGTHLDGLSTFLHSTQISRLKKDNTKYEKVHIQSLVAGDQILLNSDQVLPVDSFLDQKEAFFNTSFLTGEHLPINKKNNDIVEAGSISFQDETKLIVAKSLADSRLSKILNQIQSSWNKIEPHKKIEDKLASGLLILVSLISLIIISYFISQGNSVEGFKRALSVLIITCPCALAIGSPLSLANALKNLFKSRIIVKDADSLLKLASSQHIFFDKTGTLTEGKFQVVEWRGKKEPELFDSIFSLESFSSHPVAHSIREYIKNQNHPLKLLDINDFNEQLGVGVRGKISNSLWEIVRDPYWNKLGNSILVKKDGVTIAQIILEDKLKAGSKSAIHSLRELKYEVFLLTGDNPEISQQIANYLNIPRNHVFAQSSPEDKRNILSQYSNNIMVGDGLNDILALDQANIGISLGGKVDINLKKSNIYLPSSNPLQVVELIKFSKKIKKVIQRNLIISLTYNTLGITAAILGYINPLGAAILMPLSSFTVILSAFAGSRLKKEGGQK